VYFRNEIKITINSFLHSLMIVIFANAICLLGLSSLIRPTFITRGRANEPNSTPWWRKGMMKVEFSLLW
jgi:hypothetical protein